MSGLASLANVPRTDDAFRVYSFVHMAHHRDVNSAILRRFNVILPEFVLDPMNLNDLQAFADNHQIMHNDVNNVLSTQANDLTDINWQDEQQRAAWIWLNFSEHYRWSDKLGIG